MIFQVIVIEKFDKIYRRLVEIEFQANLFTVGNIRHAWVQYNNASLMVFSDHRLWSRGSGAIRLNVSLNGLI